MDCPEPSPAVPASSTSSAAQNTTGTTQAPTAVGAGTLGAPSAPGQSSEAPESSASESESPKPPQQPQDPEVTLWQPTSQNVQEQSSRSLEPGPQRQTSGRRPQTAPRPETEGRDPTSGERPRTAPSTPPRTTPQETTPTRTTPAPATQGTSASQFQPQPTSPLRIIEPTRPTTGSTLGGPGTDPNLLASPPTPPPRPPLPQLRMGRSTSVGIIVPSVERFEDAETLSGAGHHDLHRDNTMRTNQSLPMLPPQTRIGDNGIPRRQRTVEGPGSILGHGTTRRSGIDWTAPGDEKRKRTISERLAPTIENAVMEAEKYRAKAKATGWALNVAIGLQVLLGSLTTGLSAVATTGKSTAVPTTVLGALATLVASYLARARGSNEPELSITRVKDLEHFLREVRAFDLDRGHLDTDDYDHVIDNFRKKFEELLGNADGQRKLSPPA